LKKVSEGGAAAAQAAAIDRTTSAATINFIVARLLSLSLLLRVWADVCCFLGEMQRVPTICAGIGKTHPGHASALMMTPVFYYLVLVVPSNRT